MFKFPLTHPRPFQSIATQIWKSLISFRCCRYTMSSGGFEGPVDVDQDLFEQLRKCRTGSAATTRSCDEDGCTKAPLVGRIWTPKSSNASTHLSGGEASTARHQIGRVSETTNTSTITPTCAKTARVVHRVRGSQGEFNWSSQYFDHGGVRWVAGSRRCRRQWRGARRQRRDASEESEVRRQREVAGVRAGQARRKRPPARRYDCHRALDAGVERVEQAASAGQSRGDSVKSGADLPPAPCRFP